MKEVSVVEKAFAAARDAESAFRSQYGEPAYCGFAWVNVRPANSRVAQVLKQRYGARKSVQGGISVWNPGGSMTQSLSVKEAGADAFAAVLRAEGFNAYAESRAD